VAAFLCYTKLCVESDDEWKEWEQMGDPILHIILRDWADICIIAPLSAHTLAKVSNGLCNDTLSCVVRAWDFGHYRNGNLTVGKPMLLAPAMNTAMWEHPLTAQQLSLVESFGRHGSSSYMGRNENLVRTIAPQTKMLACGEMGIGAMADVRCIVNTVRDLLARNKVADIPSRQTQESANH
jgi:phosphopantothenoylcysteine decarboxylase